MRKIFLYILLPVACAALSACSVERVEEKKEKDLVYTTVEEEEVPEKLKEQIKKRKKEVFGLTFLDKGVLYAARGFGEKETDGYHIEVTACYESSNTIYVETELRGPGKETEIQKKSTDPYIVIKMGYSEKPVVFL